MRVIVLAALLVAGCNTGSRSVCITPPSLEDSLKMGNDANGWAEKTDACVARWSNRLAAAPGSTREIAGAAIGGCLDAIDSRAAVTNRDLLKEGFATESHDKTVAKFRAEATDKAMFYVAMTRAGHCQVR